MNRRTLLGSAAAAILATSRGAGNAAGSGPEPVPFDPQTVRNLARAMAAAPYKAPDTTLPAPLSKLDYATWRAIRFDPNQALWRGQPTPFQAQFFHRGFLYGPAVDVFEVIDGRATPVAYRPDMFDTGSLPRVPDLGFAGLRLHAPINRPDMFDECAVFLGASYFRAVARAQGYGLSARGLALNTAEPGGEEFPAFRAFWLERPSASTRSMVLSALIDSPSAAAAMRITLRPGDTTVMDCELTLFPRVDLERPGIATATSMFFFDPSNRAAHDDWRLAAHDSDGLQILTGAGEALWRPLANPRTLQISAFADVSPRGFGLMQRARRLEDYQDLEARYDRHPSLWVEPIGDWGEGSVHLVEIPTKSEVNDNIVAFWRPRQPLRAKGEHSFTYRLHWCNEAPVRSDLARIVATRTGATQAGRVFVAELAGDRLRTLPPDTKLDIRASASQGTIQNTIVTPYPEIGGWRMSFELVPGDAKLSDLRATLVQGDTPLSETWTFRWTA